MTSTKKQAFMDALMAEPIRLPGVPQFVVTRHDAYRFLKLLGDDRFNRTGFGSIDYLVFRPVPVDAPLSQINIEDIAAKIAAIEARA